MAKQKVVLKLSMEDAKKRAKALKCAVGLHGVESAAHDGDKIIVVGEGIDSVKLTTMLRRKMGYVELTTVETVEEKVKAEVVGGKKVETESQQQISWPFYNGSAMVMQLPHYAEVIDHPCYDENPCCIM